MKVLWIVNTIFPFPAKQLGKDTTCFGGWLISLHEELIKSKNNFKQNNHGRIETNGRSHC